MKPLLEYKGYLSFFSDENYNKLNIREIEEKIIMIFEFCKTISNKFNQRKLRFKTNNLTFN
jgi:hypothetical protein